MRFTLNGDSITFDDGGMNLLSSSALGELRDVIESLSGPRHAAAEGDARRLLAFRSGRPNVFAAGADMAEMERFTPAQAEAFARLGQETFAAIERLPVVTVAIVDGDCYGGALDLVLAFDLRFATPRSRFAHPGARLGIVTGFGGTSRWRKVLERSAARRLFLNNEVLPAHESLELGLVDRVGDSFEDELARLAILDPMTTRFVKELVRIGDGMSREQTQLMAERLAQLYITNATR